MRTDEERELLLDKLEKFINDYEAADAKFLDDQDKKHWNEKFGDRFGKYSDKLKTLNGDNFDIMEASRKEYHDSYGDFSDDEYADALENNIKKVLERIWPTEPEKAEEVAEQITEEVKEASDKAPKGLTETHIEAEDKDGDGEISKDEVETHTVEEVEPENKEETSDEENEEREEDAVKADYDEWEKAFKSIPRRK